jgi:hypothetical protein
MRPIEEQIARLADHAMAAHADRARSMGKEQVMRPAFRRWRFVAAGAAVAAVAVVGVIVLTGDDGNQRLVPGTVPGPTTVDTTAPAPTPTSATIDTTASTVPPKVAALTLRPGGVGEFDFGTPMDTVVAAVSVELGEMQVTDHGISGDPVLGCGIRLSASWPATDLVLAFSDRSLGEDQGFACTGVPELVGWRLVLGDQPLDTTVTMDNGIGVGATYTELKAVWPDFEMYPPSGGFSAPFFGTSGLEAPNVYVVFPDWDYVTAVQEGLVANGADLVVDGQLGPKTADAYVAFAAAHPGLRDGQLFELLGAVPPGSAPAAQIISGPGWYGFEEECTDQPGWSLHGSTLC